MNLWTFRPGWNPFTELERQMNRLFDFTQDVGRQVSQTWRPHPAFNFYEAANEYYLVAPLPGVKPEDLDINVVGNSLNLKGERRRHGSVPDEFYRRQERWLGKWSRNFQLPDKADPNQLSAALDNGLLVIKVQKLPETQPRQVPVRVVTNTEGQSNATEKS
jgi:HSP20 family protein